MIATADTNRFFGARNNASAEIPVFSMAMVGCMAHSQAPSQTGGKHIALCNSATRLV